MKLPAGSGDEASASIALKFGPAVALAGMLHPKNFDAWRRRTDPLEHVLADLERGAIVAALGADQALEILWVAVRLPYGTGGDDLLDLAWGIWGLLAEGLYAPNAGEDLDPEPEECAHPVLSELRLSRAGGQ